ncbi:Hypothetical protein NCS54_01451500 [Fusarium falciforme]|uniref:Hypothetical protein n=1 Tax=Fusarium falciforme TaxID=195108 RepID=UPI0023011CEB|nr:Hypothetical protein NCS54_01451500 [Fusarium falciforme]WAO96828.1 Hypothetical protein NCS54_01451500 [Fusarium falciforme]
MKLFTITLLATQLSAILAAPAAIQHDSRALVRPRSPHARFSLAATVTSTIVPSQTSAAAGEGGEGGEEGAEDEVEQAGEFDVPIVLPGGSKVDTLYPPGQNGVFEIEFQNAEDRTLTVTRNPSPAAPPAGFRAVEPVSFIVNLAEGAEGLTLQKVDYILNANSTLDISTGAIGRFCTEAGAFVIDPAVGELEFEAEENELLIKVNNMNGEWGIFIPDAAATPGAGGEAAPGGEATPGGDAKPDTKQQLINLLLSLLE